MPPPITCIGEVFCMTLPYGAVQMGSSIAHCTVMRFVEQNPMIKKLAYVVGVSLALLSGPVFAKDKTSNAESESAKSGAQQDASNPYRYLTGTWVGTVEEIGIAPYPIELNFDGRGNGAVFYGGFNCSGVLSPIAPLDGQHFGETITKGRQDCADGRVTLSRRGRRLEWIWYNADGDVQATALLTQAD